MADELVKLKTLFIQVFNSEPGYSVLRYIMETLCGYNKTNIVNNAETRELLLESMLFNEAKRDVWLRIRPLLSKDVLKKVEIDMDQVSKKVSKKQREHPFVRLKREENHDNSDN